MPKLLIVTICLLLARTQVLAQTHAVKGVLSDTTGHTEMKNAVISLLRAEDSILATFTRATAGGSFELKNVPAGNYVLLISHPNFADYVDIVKIAGDRDLEVIEMLSKAVMLQDVIVRGSPIRMKGDTLAYIADSFKVKDGATVEDLLKRLPGIQVNSKGEITAQGERVQKVLVDGDEFFGDDPTLATQNMIAKAVKEVQVFDKKSDQAEFTGVDDGEKTKTINLKLKDEYKKGYFGKINLAGGLPDRWENSGMINAFKDKRKLSVYGKMANTGATGLGWSEETQYGGGVGVQTEVSDDGGIYISANSDEFGGIGSYGGEGLPKSWMAGTSYSNKWNEDKNSIVGAYRYQKLSTSGITTTNTQTILKDTTFFNNEISASQASRWRNRGNLKAEINLDSSQSLTVSANGHYGGLTSYSSNKSESLRSDGLPSSKLPVNINERITTNDGTNGSFNANVLYKKKFKKKSRTFSLNLSERYSMNNSDGFLKSRLDLFREGQFLRTDTIDQKKVNDNTSLTIDSRASYTEPIGKNGILEINYGYGFTNSEQKRLSYDKLNGKYDVLNDLFSNDYKFATGTHKGGIAYRYNYKKITFGLGSDVAHSNWKQTDLFTDVVRKYDFNNFFPRANFAYKLGQYSRLRFNYNGRTQAPSINQLQPVLNNADPLNIALGNPNLKQSFNNRFDAGYNFYQVLKEQGLWASIYYNATSNDFSTFNTVDSLGRRLYQTVNVDGNYNFGAYMGYNFKWKKPDLRFNINFNPQIRRNNNFVNGQANETNARIIGFNFNISRYKDKKYSFEIGLNGNHNYSKSSISPDVVTKYWTATPTLDVNLFLPLDFEFITDFDYYWRQRTAVFNNNNAFIWNASLNKKIMKKQNMRLGVKVNDMLNQNIGFRRDVNTNFVTERTYNVIRRYWMATLTWNFNKGPQKEAQW